MIRDWARRLKREALTVWLIARDRRVGWAPKLLAGAVAAYAFSPVDLVPDFIPVLGLLDDLLIVPAGVWLVLRMVPEELVASLRTEAEVLAERPVSRGGMVAVFALWALAAWLVWRALA